MKARQIWDEADIQRLRSLAQQGADSRAIAMQLGRRVESVQTKARSEGIPIGRRSHQRTARERASAFLS